jgi:hypothetical protein
MRVNNLERQHLLFARFILELVNEYGLYEKLEKQKKSAG